MQRSIKLWLRSTKRLRELQLKMKLLKARLEISDTQMEYTEDRQRQNTDILERAKEAKRRLLKLVQDELAKEDNARWKSHKGTNAEDDA